MSPALLILSIESLGACMREEQKRISFSFKKKRSFLQVLMCWIIVTRRFHLCFWGSVTDYIRPQRRNLQYDYMCWQDGGDKNSIKGPAIIQRCQFYTVTAFKIASVTQHCFLHSGVALEGHPGSSLIGATFQQVGHRQKETSTWDLSDLCVVVPGMQRSHSRLIVERLSQIRCYAFPTKCTAPCVPTKTHGYL